MILVAGIGSEWRGDDAAGLAVARALRGSMPVGVSVMELGGGPAGLLDALGSARRAFVVDAVRSGADAGTVHRIDPLGMSPPGVRWGSTHAIGTLEAIALAARLGRLPGELAVYGIEGERFDLGAGLSAPVQRAVAAVATELRARVQG